MARMLLNGAIVGLWAECCVIGSLLQPQRRSVMQQFARALQGGIVIPALVRDAQLLDLRPLIADITPETIASGVLTKVDSASLKPLSGEMHYLAPIQGIRQVPA